MPAPKGNQFWKLRSKHGRDALFTSPEKLWQAACEYFEWCEDNPLLSTEYLGKDAEERQIPKMRPFTLTGLCLYLDCNSVYFQHFKETETGKKEDFRNVITRIEETIYTQKFSGAAAGFLNANIISRDLGLIDKKDLNNNHTGEVVVTGMKIV